MQANDLTVLEGEVKMETEAAVSFFYYYLFILLFSFFTCVHLQYTRDLSFFAHVGSPVIFLHYVACAQKSDADGKTSPSQVWHRLTGTLSHIACSVFL